MNNARSAVLWPGEKLMSLEDVLIEDPRDDEVLVKIVASGVCHTDMIMRDQVVPTPQPVVLGHEGAGVVEKVGEDVKHLQAGDHVAMSFSTCGHCPCCTRGAPAYCHEFFPLNFFGSRGDASTSILKGDRSIHSHIFGQSSFSTRAVCHQRNLIKVDKAIPLELLGPFGCGFQTGAGAVFNSLRVEENTSVMILGAGTVGMAATMAADIAGATTIIAVDVHESRLTLAKEIGATHTINTHKESLEVSAEEIRNNSGVDYVIDTTSYLPLVQQSLALLAPQGELALAAAYKPEDALTLDVMPFMSTGRKIRGVVEGDSDIQTFIPQLLAYYRDGRFPVDKIVRYFELDDINDAINASESGDVVKAVVVMPQTD